MENTRNSFFSSEQDTLCHYWIKKNDFKPWVTYRTNIIFLRVITSNLTGLPSSVARYRGHNGKGSSIFTRNHELFCLLDKHYSPLLAKKVDYTKKWEFDIPSSPEKVARRRVTSKQLIGDINQCSLYDKFFYQLSLKKALRSSPIFIFRFCRDNFVKLLKIRTVNLFLLPANSALRMFAVKSEKNL